MVCFQLGDHLHGANLRRAAERAGGEGGAHEIKRRFVSGKPSFDLGDDMHDVAVALDDHQVFHLHGAEIAHPADVIARQVDQHDVLGPFLGVGQQFGFVRLVLFGCLAAGPRSGDGPDLNVPLFAPDMDFRGSSHQAEPVQFEQEHIGRGIDRARRAVNVERTGRNSRGKPL